MKIIFTGGVTGGHFYPIIAIAESIQKISKEKNTTKKVIKIIMDFYSYMRKQKMK